MPDTNLIGVLRQALGAARANDRPRTRTLLHDATRIDPHSEPAWQWLATVTDSPDEALAAYEKVLSLNPSNERVRSAMPAARLKAGIAAVKAKDIPTARRHLKRVVGDDPDSEQGWLWLAAVCDTPAEGQAHLNRVLAINPSNKAAKKGLDYYRTKLAKAAAKPADQNSGIIRFDPTRSHDSATETGNLGPVTPPPAPHHTLLVVDESKTIRKLVSMSATAEGFRVIEAVDAMDAADRILADGPPDIAVIDAALPGVDGYELCKLIRMNPGTKSVPLLIMTGKDGLFDAVRGATAGVTAAVPKPLDPAELVQSLRAHCPVPPTPRDE